MIEPARVLQPLDAARDALDRLLAYDSLSGLADPLASVGSAVERTLRLLLSADPGTPADLRSAAHSADELPWNRLLEALRRQDLITIELAGLVHELHATVQRAAAGDVRSTDAELARNTAERTRAEVHAAAERPVRSAAHVTAGSGALDAQATPVPAPRRGQRGMLGLAIGMAVFALAVIVAVYLLRPDPLLDDGVDAFRAGRMAEAEAAFQEVVRRDPSNVTARLFLGRIYRRQGEHAAAAEELREAARLAPQDATVQRELGHLFMDLGQPESAAARYRRAVELEPDQELNWIGLVRALRAAGDPTAEDVLQRAPPGVRATIETPR